MKRILFAAAYALTATSAIAADIPVKAPPAPAAVFNWTGLYLGGTVGYNNGDLDWRYHNVGTAPAGNPYELSGWNGGGFVGLQWQVGSVVLGAEANGLWGSIKGWALCPGTAYRCESSADDLWTVGGRLGYVWASSRLMSFVSGGFASARVDTATPLIATGVPFDTSSARHDGWYIGGGTEFVLTGNWIFGTEYRHYRLDSRIHTAVPANSNEDRTIKPEWDSWLFRLSYKLGWGGPVAAR